MVKRRLLIASPAKGGLPPAYFALHDMLSRNPIPGWEIEWLVECANSLLNISRNIIANEALKKGTELLALDTDHPLPWGHVERVLSHDLERYPIVSALYCIKRPGDPFWLGIRERGAKEDENGLMPAAFLPTGCLRISNAALKQIVEFHKDREVYIQDDNLLPPNTTPTNGTMVELFPYGVCGPRTPAARMRRVRKAMESIVAGGVARATRPQKDEALQQIINALTNEEEPGFLLGDDFFMSLLAKQAGVPMFIDTHCVIPHTGPINYPLTESNLLATRCNSIPEYAGTPDNW